MVDHQDGFFLPPSGGNRISSSCIYMMERGGGSWKSNTTELSPACPRCGSSNTKFCYYNNYSLTQPRYFCKGCRRYWTKGGSLRNVPIGGGCRKSRRSHHMKRSPPPIRVPSTTNNIHGNFVAPSPFILISTTPHRYSPNNSRSTIPGLSSPDGPNIDLALVYANFLNPNKPQPPQETASYHHHQQQQEQQQQHEIIPQLPNDNNTNILDHNPGPSFEFLGDLLSAPQHQQDGSLSHDGNYVICHSGGLDPLHHHHFFTNVKNNNDPSSNINSNNYVLPPLPDDEELLVVSQEMVWPSISAVDDLMIPMHQILDIDYSSPPNSSLVQPQGQNCQRPPNANDDMSSLINISNLDDIFKNRS